MKKTKIGLLIVAVAMFISVQGVVAQAGGNAINELISLSPGEAQTREFVLYSPFDIKSFGPAEGWVILATGDNETMPGKLTISLSTSTKIPFGDLMTYSLAGFAFSLDGGPVLINESATTPWKIKKVITMNSTFGFAYAGALIKEINGNIDLPALFAITFELAVAEKK